MLKKLHVIFCWRTCKTYDVSASYFLVIIVHDHANKWNTDGQSVSHKWHMKQFYYAPRFWSMLSWYSILCVLQECSAYTIFFFGGHRKYTCTSEGVSEEGDDESF